MSVQLENNVRDQYPHLLVEWSFNLGKIQTKNWSLHVSASVWPGAEKSLLTLQTQQACHYNHS